MKRLLTILLILVAFAGKAQDQSPLPNVNVKKLISPNNPIFYFNPVTYDFWVFMGEYGWKQLKNNEVTSITFGGDATKMLTLQQLYGGTKTATFTDNDNQAPTLITDNLGLTGTSTTVSIAYKEDKSNKVTSVSGSSTDVQYPSAKLLYDQLTLKEPTLTKGNLTESIAGLQFNNTRQVIGGAADLSLTAGYLIPTTVSATSWDNKQPQLNGTGFIKASGTTISYDNSTYVPTGGQAGSVANSVTFNNSGAGDASGATFNGSAAKTISSNTIGALNLNGGTMNNANLVKSLNAQYVNGIESSRIIYGDNQMGTNYSNNDDSIIKSGFYFTDDTSLLPSKHIIQSNWVGGAAVWMQIGQPWALDDIYWRNNKLGTISSWHKFWTDANFDQSTKEDKSNKVTSISSGSTDTQYPSAKLLYDQLALKAPTSGSGNYIQNQNSVDQTANIRISGTGQFASSIQATTAKFTTGAADNTIFSGDATGLGTWKTLNAVIGNSELTTNYHTKWNGSNLVNSLIYDNGTNVGIGTTSPSGKLQISSATVGDDQIWLQSTTYTGGYSKLGYNGVTGEFRITQNDGGLGMAFYTGAGTPTEKMRITTGGNIGIGYSSGTEISNNKLAVNGSGYFNTSLRVNGLSGTGTRLVTASSTGQLGVVSGTGFVKADGTTDSNSYLQSPTASFTSFPRANNDNSVSWLGASDFRTAIGAGTSNYQKWKLWVNGTYYGYMDDGSDVDFVQGSNTTITHSTSGTKHIVTIASTAGTSWNHGYQDLSGTTINYNVANGINANITLSGNTTINMSNVQAGMVGSITLINDASIRTLTFSGYTFKISAKIRNTTNSAFSSGSSRIDKFTWDYDGVRFSITGEYNLQ